MSKFIAPQTFHLFTTFPSLFAAGNCLMTNSSLWAVRKSNMCHFIMKAVKSFHVIIQGHFLYPGEPGNLVYLVGAVIRSFH